MNWANASISRRIPALAVATFLGAGPAAAQSVVDTWNAVKTPPPPTLKSVTIDPKTTALLILDYVPRICSPRPGCATAAPKVKALLAQARAHRMLVIYSMVNGSKPSDIIKDVAPTGEEPIVVGHSDKFLGTDLDDILKKHNIKTLLATGGAAEGAVLYTSSHAAFLNYKIVVPVDGAWSDTRFAELATIYMLSHAPQVAQQITLTSFDKIGF